MENKTLLIVTMTALLILIIITRFSACLNQVNDKLRSVRNASERWYHRLFIQNLSVIHSKLKLK